MSRDPTLQTDRRNVVLTGLPRGGTTLVCHLLNTLPDTVALFEPIGPRRFADLLPDHEAVAEGVGLFYKRMRRMALTEGVVVTKHKGGKVPDNPFEGGHSGDGPRKLLTSKGKVEIRKKLERNFFLIIKDPPMFSAILPVLVEQFPVYAIVRNPLATIASWNSVDMPLREGRVPTAERYDSTLTPALDTLPDKTARHLHMLNWWCERFLDNLPPEHIIRYEDIIDSKGRVLSVIVPAAEKLDEPLENRNRNVLYDRDEMMRVGERLLESEGAYWRLYTRESVEDLLGEIS